MRQLYPIISAETSRSGPMPDDEICRCGLDGWVHRQYGFRGCPLWLEHEHQFGNGEPGCLHIDALNGQTLEVDGLPSCGYCGVHVSDMEQ